jgi:hypothetical protein
MNTQPGIGLAETPSILYNDRKVTYYETAKGLIDTIQTQCRELLYVFTGEASTIPLSNPTMPTSGGRTKRVIRKHTHVHDMQK